MIKITDVPYEDLPEAVYWVIDQGYTAIIERMPDRCGLLYTISIPPEEMTND